MRSQHGAVELANLVVALSSISDGFELSEVEVAKIVGARVGVHEFDLSGVDYFGMMTALRYIECEKKYSGLAAAINGEIEKRLLAEGDPSLFCDRVMMFVDFVSCPHVDRKIKLAIVERMHIRCLGRIPPNGMVGQVTNFIERDLGFTEWGKGLKIEQMLQKKALKVAY
ncbi:MAG: hypothetical protein A2X76_11810 [Lysobacterales bacterium GWF1_69_6]|nr:MAG: hypothetical protein A2X76_11810 [Xanthomonadales bacterium GWF1_69_6]